jgi:hypothetical protein
LSRRRPGFNSRWESCLFCPLSFSSRLVWGREFGRGRRARIRRSWRGRANFGHSMCVTWLSLEEKAATYLVENEVSWVGKGVLREKDTAIDDQCNFTDHLPLEERWIHKVAVEHIPNPQRPRFRRTASQPQNGSSNRVVLCYDNLRLFGLLIGPPPLRFRSRVHVGNVALNLPLACRLLKHLT